MSRWFRHYAGMMRDEKLVRAALKARQPIERVVWVWGAILESAAEINDDGRFELDTAEVAYFLRSDQDDIDTIAACLENLGRTAGGRVAKWGDRQYQSDRSSDRVRAHRERKRTRNGDQDHPETLRNDDETVLKRSRNAPETETETEAEREEQEPSVPRASAPPARDDDPTQAAFDAYNSQAALAGWSQAQSLNPTRRSALKARLKDAGGLDGWTSALVRARGSPLMTGGGRDGWLPNLDFFLQAKSFTKLIEGAYDGKRSNPAQKPAAGDGGRTNPMVAAFIAEAARADDRRMEGWSGDPGPDFGGGPIMDLQPSGRSRSQVFGDG